MAAAGDCGKKDRDEDAHERSVRLASADQQQLVLTGQNSAPRLARPSSSCARGVGLACGYDMNVSVPIEAATIAFAPKSVSHTTSWSSTYTGIRHRVRSGDLPLFPKIDVGRKEAELSGVPLAHQI